MLRYPDAPRDAIVDTLHGSAVADPYRWLEDPMNTASRTWSAAQRDLFEERAATWITRAHWHRRVGELLAGGGVSVPTWRGERQFFMRRNPDQQLAVLITIDADGSERVLIDPMALDADGLTTLDAWQPSPDGTLLAYQLSEGGTEESAIRVMRVADGSLIDGPIDRVRYSPIAWLPDNSGYYYVRKPHPSLVPADEMQYHRRVLLHRLGTDPDHDDAEIFGAGQVITNYYGVDVSRDGRWLQISVSEGTATRNDLWWADLSASSPEAPALQPIQVGVDAQTWIHATDDGRAFVYTDLDAPRGRIMSAPAADPRPEQWTELVAEQADSVLDSFLVLEDGLAAPELFVAWSTHTVASITAHDAATGEPLRTLTLPGFGTIAGFNSRYDGGHEFWYSYTDHTTLGSVYRYDASTDAHSLWATPPGSVEVPAVHTHHITYTSADGTEVRMFVIAPSAKPEGPRPTILYGYGGFGLTLEPAYSGAALAWVEAGGIYAIANIRGGGEEGEEWHRDGMLGKKQNCFDDFIAAAQWLISEGWTTPEQLSVSGGSNGGLLVGAVMTQRPELFAAVLCEAALLDMVRYEQFGLGATWNVEYGSAAKAEEFAWLHAYSPYHRVVEGTAYPATMFTVFDSDSRVDPMHVRKMAAAVQHAQSADRDILIRAEGNVGHGARSLDRSIELVADKLAFAAHWTGLEVPDA
jgi:prolyl oligopeptidase